MSEKHLVSFEIGNRYQQTLEKCPNCHQSNLSIDKMSEGTYVCLKCNYIEERKTET